MLSERRQRWSTTCPGYSPSGLSANTAGRFFDFLTAFHRLAHTGTQATKQQMATRVMCKGLNSDMATWYKIC